MNPDKNLQEILRLLLNEKKLINESIPAIDIFDFDYFAGRLKQLHDAFPEPFFLHAMAMKANSLRGILRFALENGAKGSECASISEAIHAVSTGFKPENVVYDSPCKTRVDIKKALDMGIVINLDNDYEMEIVDDLLKTSCKGCKSPSIGLRVNPVVGAGSIAIISTATKLSKFGLPLTDETRGRIISLYKKYEWLNGIHFHVGSQGCAMDLFVKAAEVIMGLVHDVEQETGRDLAAIDIGGGLSTSYADVEEPEGFAYPLYRSKLQEVVPQLFSGKYRIITEFGRSLFLKAGKTLTRVETIKQWLPDVQPIILTHVGANQFIREIYRPDLYQHRFGVSSPDGFLKNSGSSKDYDIAGPLCFQGDYLARNVSLPEVEMGDIIVIHETGAYTIAMYSKFNSILPSPVYGYYKTEAGEYKIVCLKERETPQQILEFWGSSVPRVI